MPGGSRFPNVSDFDKSGGISRGYVDDAAKVFVNGVTSAASFPIGLNLATITGSASNTQTTGSSSTETIRSAAGGSTDTAIAGFSIWNQTTDSRIVYKLSCGTHVVAFGGLAPQAAFNWNKIGGWRFKTNAAISGFINGLDGSTVTALWHVDFKDKT